MIKYLINVARHKRIILKYDFTKSRPILAFNLFFDIFFFIVFNNNTTHRFCCRLCLAEMCCHLMHNTINYKRCQNRQFKCYDNYVFKYQNKTQDMQIIKALDKISKSNITNIKQMLCNHFNRKLKRNYKIPKKMENFEFESISI